MQKNVNHTVLQHNCKLPKKLEVDIKVCMVQCFVYLIDKACWEMERRCCDSESSVTHWPMFANWEMTQLIVSLNFL